MTSNLHKAAYDIAYSHLRRLERIKRLMRHVGGAETITMVDYLVALGLLELKAQFLLINQFRAAELTMSNRFACKDQQPFWYRQGLESDGYFNFGNCPQFKYRKPSTLSRF